MQRQDYAPANGQEIANSGSQERPVNYQRSESQIEAESRFAPPSYNSLPVFTEQVTEGPSARENDKDDAFANVKCYSENSPRPPAYKCVMEHQEMFKVSQNDIHIDAETEEKSFQAND